MKKFLVSLTLTLGMMTSVAHANELDRALQAAKYGPEIKNLRVVNHGFNIKPVMSNKLPDGSVKIVGQISHHLSMRPDDQIHYTIIKKGNTVQSIKKEISRGGGTRMLSPFVSAAGLAYGKPINPNDINKVGSSFGSLTDGQWEPAVDLIIEHIAITY